MSVIIVPHADSDCQSPPLTEKQFLFLFHLRNELSPAVWNIAHLSTGVTKTGLTDLTQHESARLINHFHCRLSEVRL